MWVDVGQSIEAASGLAQQVEINTVKIEEVGGKVTSTAESLQVLRASSRPDDTEGELAEALAAWESKAAIANERLFEQPKRQRLRAALRR